MSDRVRIALLALILALAGFVFHFAAWSERWHPTWDSAVYLTLARNLSEGEGYVYGGAPHLKYPPGLPVLLAPFASEPGAPVGAERGWMIFCALAWMQLLFFGLRRSSGVAVAFGVALSAGLSYGVLLHTVRILSDVPFLLPWTGSLLLGERLRRQPSWGSALAFVACTVLAASIRVVAIVAIPVYVLLLAARFRGDRRVRAALCTALALLVVAIGGWFARNAWLRPQISEDLRDQRSYEHELATGESYEAGAEGVGLGGQLRIALGNLDYTRGLIGEVASAYVFPAQSRDQLAGGRDEAGWWFGLAASLLTIWTWVRLARRWPWLIWSTVLYLALIVVWPSRQGVRFLLPALPALYLGWIAGAASLAERLGASRAWGAGLLSATLLGTHFFLAALPIYEIEREAVYDNPARQLSDEAGDYIREQLPDARVVAGEAAYLVYRCGIDARAFPILDADLSQPERGRLLYERLRDVHVTHVLLLPEGGLTWPHLIEPLISSVDPALLLQRAPEAATALAAWSQQRDIPGGGPAFLVPLTVFSDE